jgi:hypothetical protein
MECIETLTTSGHGRWGDDDTAFALSTVRRTWRSRWSDTSRSVDTFVLTFDFRDYHGQRSFPTAIEREAFLDSHIANRSVGGDASSLLKDCRPWVENYVGDDIVGVWFVMDYFQLQFQQGVTNFYAWPQVRTGESRLDFGDPGYRDGLCGFITHTVTFADIFLDDGLVIGFDIGELVVTPDQFRSAPDPEVVEFGAQGLGAREAPFD